MHLFREGEVVLVVLIWCTPPMHTFAWKTLLFYDKEIIFILQCFSLFLVMVPFFYVAPRKGKTFCGDDEPARHVNSIMYSDHSVSVLQRWGTHAWCCCPVKSVWWFRELSVSDTTGGAYGRGPSEGLNAYRDSCWCLKSSVASNVILQTRGCFVITKNSWWEGSSGGRLAWSV